jgi:hypothetical protein
VIALGVCCSDTQKYRLRLGFCIIRAHTSLIDEFIEEVTNLVQMKFCVFVFTFLDCVSMRAVIEIIFGLNGLVLF